MPLTILAAEPRTGGWFDYVVNVAAETAHGKSAAFYEKMVTIATKLGAGAFLESLCAAEHVRLLLSRHSYARMFNVLTHLRR